MESKTISVHGRLLGEFQKAAAPTKRTGPYTYLPFTLAPSLSFRCCYPIWVQDLLQCLHSDDWQHRINTTAISGGNLHSFLVFVVKTAIGKHHLWLHGNCTSVIAADIWHWSSWYHSLYVWLDARHKWGTVLAGPVRGMAFPWETMCFPPRHIFQNKFQRIIQVFLFKIVVTDRFEYFFFP